LAERRGCDLVVVVRGGGARTDLATFDSEDVARAIASLEVPVWPGIGHEVDRSVADEVAHTAFKTPTAAAQALVERVGAYLGEVEARWAGICGLAKVRVDEATVAVDARAGLVERDVRAGLRRAEDRLDGRAERVRREAALALRSAEARLGLFEARVSASDPQRALARGWSLTRTADGQLVRDPTQVAPGSVIVSTVAGGDIRSTVDGDG
jgi:exodeoxyribonuclease VII large subunit